MAALSRSLSLVGLVGGASEVIQAQLARIQAHTRERAKIRFNSALHRAVGNLPNLGEAHSTPTLHHSHHQPVPALLLPSHPHAYERQSDFVAPRFKEKESDGRRKSMWKRRRMNLGALGVGRWRGLGE